jgi:hypothetical protein
MEEEYPYIYSSRRMPRKRNAHMQKVKTDGGMIPRLCE